MNLREQALAAYQAAVAAAEQAAAARLAAKRAEDIAAFGAALSALLHEQVVVDDLEVEIGGIPFCWWPQSDHPRETARIGIGIPCSRAGCDGLVWHQMRFDNHRDATLADVGRVLTETIPEPCWRHYDEDGELIPEGEEAAE